MEFAKLIKPSAIFAAVSLPMSAHAATTINVNYTPTLGGTPITIGGASSPQYNFQSDGTGFKAYINANGTSRVGFPGDPADQTQVQTAGFFGGGTDGNYSLAFNIGSVAYTGFASVDRDGEHISRITYDVATSAVPEPATWALMILGFGATGVAMRRRRQIGTLAAA